MEKPKNTGIRILLTEDDDINQKIASGIIEKLGYHVDVVANGKDAVKALEETLYDLVLMDCQMPEMDGYKATRAIRSHESRVMDHKIPVIAMTAYAMEGDRELCISAGMNDYISKPVSLKSLAEVIEKWLPLEKKKKGGKEREEDRADSFDSFIFDKLSLLSRLGDDMDLARSIASGFLDDIPKQIGKLRSYIDRGNAVEAKFQAHKIKGAAASIGGEALKKTVHEIEKNGNTKDIVKPENLISEIEDQFIILKETMEYSLRL